MARISLGQARAGQEVVRPVVNNNGVILVQAGARLTDSLIERLHDLGITVVVVAGADPSAKDKAPAERLAEIDRRFAGHEEDHLMMHLKRIVSAQVAESTQE